MPVPIRYPAAPRAEQVDVYHGVPVADPYRELEDLDAPATRQWIDEQAALTEAYLGAIPVRDGFRRRLFELTDYEKRSVPVRYGDRYIYSKNSGLQNQAVVVQTPSLDREAAVLIDPNLLSADGTVALAAYAPTLDGSLIAYALAGSGSDWHEWRVRRTSDGTDLSDVVRWSKFSGIAWTRANDGFFYARFAEPDRKNAYKAANVDQKVMYHRLGTAQAADVKIYERPDDSRLFFGMEVTHDGRYLIVTETDGGSRNAVLYCDIAQSIEGEFVRLFEADSSHEFIGNAGTRFYFLIDTDAPRAKIVALDLAAPGAIVDVIPEQADAMQSAALIDGKLAITYSHDVCSVIRVYTLEGEVVGDVPLPGLGSAGLSGWPDRAEAFLSFTSYTLPASIFRYDMRAHTQSPYFTPSVPFDPAAYATEQVFVTSKDGTRVPMFLIHRKGLVRDGSAPAILYGYGGFNLAQTPMFSSLRLAWLELGGVFAVVNLRGGSEYGEAWHQAGMLDRKQNVFDDYVAAAQWLIDRRVTSREKLAAQGGSNGGLLVGAAITQRPDLFAAAIPQVGVMDMLRFHKFTIGAAWIAEYGSADDAAQFGVLYAYSPLHNLRAGHAYPATMVMTADHDDRVFPAHSFKFAAAMQAAQAGLAPVLIRIETKAGHGAGTPLAKAVDEYSDLYAFLWKNLNVGETPERAAEGRAGASRTS